MRCVPLQSTKQRFHEGLGSNKMGLLYWLHVVGHYSRDPDWNSISEVSIELWKRWDCRRGIPQL